MRFKTFVKLEEETKEVYDLSEGQLNPLFKNDSSIFNVDKAILNGRTDKAEVIAKISDIYHNLYPKLLEIQKKMDTIMRSMYKNYKNVQYRSRLKPIDSIIDKAVNRKKGIAQMNDLVRCAILFETNEDVEDFIKTIRRKYKNSISWYQNKEKGGEQVYGYYGSHHIDFEVDGMICEIQVMSRKLWAYKKAAHKVYTANRSKEGGPSKEDAYLSKKLFSMGNAPSYVREEFAEFIDMELLESDIIDMGDFEDFEEST